MMRRAGRFEGAARITLSSTNDAPSAVSAKGGVFLLRERIEERLRLLARRAGLAGVPTTVVAGALVVLGLAVVLAAWRWWPRADDYGTTHGDPAPVSAKVSAGAQDRAERGAPAEQSTFSVEASASAPVWVHVVGAVRQPGVYQLAPGSRVADAVDAAGGLLAGAAQAGVNLAREVADGEQVAVPTQDEFAHGAGAPSAGTGAAPGAPSGAVNAGPININSADATALDALPGVGPSTAAKIVADRQANGPFATPDDLGRVTGIGPKKLEQLKVLICVR